MEIRYFELPISKGQEGLKDVDRRDLDFLMQEMLEHRECLIPEKFEEMRIAKYKSLAVSAHRSKQMIYNIARSNLWECFVTLTFDPGKVDRFNFVEVSKKMSQFLKDFKRRKCPGLKYIGVPEEHKNGAYHFHFLMSGLKESDKLNLTRATNFHTKKYKNTSSGKAIWNLDNYTWGWSTLVWIENSIDDSARCANYLTKYITKDLKRSIKGKRCYWSSKNCFKAEEVEMNLTEIEFNELLKTYKNKNAITSDKVTARELESGKKIETRYINLKLR